MQYPLTSTLYIALHNIEDNINQTKPNQHVTIGSEPKPKHVANGSKVASKHTTTPLSLQSRIIAADTAPATIPVGIDSTNGIIYSGLHDAWK